MKQTTNRWAIIYPKAPPTYLVASYKSVTAVAEFFAGTEVPLSKDSFVVRVPTYAPHPNDREL